MKLSLNYHLGSWSHCLPNQRWLGSWDSADLNGPWPNFRNEKRGLYNLRQHKKHGVLWIQPQNASRRDFTIGSDVENRSSFSLFCPSEHILPYLRIPFCFLGNVFISLRCDCSNSPEESDAAGVEGIGKTRWVCPVGNWVDIWEIELGFRWRWRWRWRWSCSAGQPIWSHGNWDEWKSCHRLKGKTKM